MWTFSDMLKKGYSLHRRIVKDEKTVGIVIVTPEAHDFEYWIKADYGTLEFEKHNYTFVSNNQDHISKMLLKMK